MQTRNTFARLINSKAALVGLSTGVVVALAGVTYGYSSMSTSVTMTVDGQQREVSAMGDTVADMLAAENIELGPHDIVAPSPDEQVVDGSAITVRYGRPLTLAVDGDKQKYWVTATDVGSALTEIGRRFSGADLSTSRGGSIDRDGMRLAVTTPKTIQVKIGEKKFVKKIVPAATGREAIKELGVKVDKNDIVRTPAPAPAKAKANATKGAKADPEKGLQDGDKVVFTRVKVVKKHVDGEVIDFGTIEREDSSLYEGETETVRDGQTGHRDVTYRIVFHNGHLFARKVLSQTVLDNPVDAIVHVGTKEQVAATNFASGSTVWDQLAQCESGGNWAINTGNGYYGGLQFNLGTWQSYGGHGLPSENSREEQIRIATLVRNASGGYGAWPACAASLGLPT